MLNKKEFLLQSIIQAYIKELEPIGSAALKNMYGITYSPATIRGYFKKLGDEGYLAQEHISSGRTPTIDALKEYWNNRIASKLNFVDYDNMQLYAKSLGVTVFFRQRNNDKLQRILNIENIYMLLEFSGFSITIKFNSALFRFLEDMIGFEPSQIIKISKEVGANVLYEELAKYISNASYEIVNLKQFLQFAVEYDLKEHMINKFLNGEILNNIEQGLYFEDLLPSGYIGICHNTTIDDTNVDMLVVGNLSKDYEYFYKGITK